MASGMASQLPLQGRLQGELGFKSINILKSDTLGRGSYGAVYKAYCDKLLCAAKVLHPTLFDLSDPAQQEPQAPWAHRLPIRRFEQECRLLRAIRHPNIVQYLGICEDPSTNLPVLLMELMDESLTHFLETSLAPIPFHTQVNICHDISLAISFLHSNGIIHRDLSSNNVLMIGDRRAKVTDFGMATMFNFYAQTLTSIPGTIVYMPPEALLEKPSYSFKLDCFTLGVLMIQIMTKLFPKPGEKMRRADRDGEEFYKRALECERRSNHTTLVTPSHPLLALAIDCIEDDENRRPPADTIVERVNQLKSSFLYGKSQNDARYMSNLLQQKEEQIQLLSTEFQRRINSLENQLQVQRRLEEDGATAALNKDITMTFRAAKRSPRALHRMSNAIVDGNILYFLNTESHVIFYAYNSITFEWSQLPDIDPDSEWHVSTIAVTLGFLTTIGGYDENEMPTNKLFSLVTSIASGSTTWEELLPPMPTKRDGSIAFSYGHYLVVAGGIAEDESYLRRVEVLDTDTLQWSVSVPLPEPLSTASTALCGDNIFMLGGWFSANTPTCSVLTCNVEHLLHPGNLCANHEPRHDTLWKRIADLPVLKSTCIAFRDHLIAVGGVDVMNKATNAVYMYDWTFNSWRVIGHMLVARGQAFAAVLPSDEVLVVGGHKGYYLNKIYEVEMAVVH